MPKPVYHAHVMENVGYVFKCKFCGTLNVVTHEYQSYEWEHCILCDCINCVCPTLKDEEIQDKINPVK